MELYGDVLAFGCFVALMAYVWTLQWVLRTCAPQNRTMRPALVWLQVMPFLGTIWQFFVIRAIEVSLATEYRSRSLPRYREPGENLGLTKAIVDALAFTLAVGFLISGWVYASYPEGTRNLSAYVWYGFFFVTGLVLLASFVLSVLYWAAIHRSAWLLRSPGPRQPDLDLDG